MNRSSVFRRMASPATGVMALALALVGADGPKQTIEARGLKFEAPASWKSTPPTSQMRLAVLKVEPAGGDGYPAELIVYAFPGGAGSVEDNVKRWQNQFKDKEGHTPKIEAKKVKGKNVEVTQVETAGHYTPASFGRPEPERDDARLLGAIVVTDQVGYFLKMVGPDKTMTKLKPEFEALTASIAVEGR